VGDDPLAARARQDDPADDALLDEAEQLSDRVAVLRDGRIVATGTPADLTRTPATEIRYRENGHEVVLRTEEPTRVLAELTARAVEQGRELDDLQVRKPSLEEVYLELTDSAAE
jgi:ABC-2 type transport system ATP-binding protein